MRGTESGGGSGHRGSTRCGKSSITTHLLEMHAMSFKYTHAARLVLTAFVVMSAVTSCTSVTELTVKPITLANGKSARLATASTDKEELRTRARDECPRGYQTLEWRQLEGATSSEDTHDRTVNYRSSSMRGGEAQRPLF